MKILMILTELGPGGAEKVTLEMCRCFTTMKHKMTVVSLKPRPPEGKRFIPEELASLGVKIIYLNMTKHNPFRAFRLFSVIREEEPDVIHAHLIHASLLSRIANIFAAKPLVNTLHISERRVGKKYLFKLDKLTFRLCNIYTAVSKAAAEYHEKMCGFPPGTMRIIYNGVNPVPKADKALLDSLKKEWGIESCTKIIGAIGRLVPQKGYDLLLDRIPAITSKIPVGQKWAFVVIGDGVERKNFESRALELNAAHANIHVFFAPYRPDAASVMDMFDVFVMPSRYEGYGLALTEAMTLGLPVVCSSADSLPELCALYKGYSRIADFSGENEAALADTIVNAASVGKSEGHVIKSISEMLDEYLIVYEDALSLDME